MWATRSVELNSKFVRKLYFPRLILPIGGYIPALIEYGIYCILLILGLVFYGVSEGNWYLEFGPELLLVPLGLLLSSLLVFGIGMFTSIFGTYGRDTRWTIPVLPPMFDELTLIDHVICQTPANK